MALGGLACALGGAALGATGLAGSPTSHFTAALLMTGKFNFYFFTRPCGLIHFNGTNYVRVIEKYLVE